MYALLIKHPFTGLQTVHQIEPEPIGHPSLDWVDIASIPGAIVGWVRRPDGSLGPYVPPIEDARAAQVKALRTACAQAITADFASDALGAAHRYGANDKDQANLTRKAMAAITGGEGWTTSVWCADAAGTWAQVAHNAPQVHKLVRDFEAAQSAASAKLAGLNAAVAAATNVEAVRAVAWS